MKITKWRIKRDNCSEEESRERFDDYIRRLKDDGEKIVEIVEERNNMIITME